MKLKNKFIYIFISFALFPLIISTIIINFVVQDSNKKDAYNRLTSELLMAQNSMKGNIEMIKNIALDSRNDELIHRYLKDSNSNEIKNTLLDKYKEFMDRYGILTNVTFFDKNAKPLSDATRSGMELKTYAVPDYFYIAKDTKELVVGNVKKGNTSGRAIFPICVPIYNIEKDLIGYVVYGVDLQRLSEKYVTNIKIGQSGYIFVIDKEGTTVLHNDAEEVYSKNFLQVDMSKKVLETKKGIGEYKYKGVNKLTAYNEDESMGLIYLAVISTSELIETSKKVINITVVMGILILIISFGVALFISSKIVKPISILKSGADEIASGKLHVRINIDSQDEIGELAKRFNSMAEKLGAAFSDIDKISSKIFAAIDEYMISNEIANSIAMEITGTKTEGVEEDNLVTVNLQIDKYENDIVHITKRLIKIVEQFTNKNRALESMNLELEKALEKIQITQKHLIESEKMAALGSLVAGVSHEINTPLGIGITTTSFISKINNDLRKKLSEGKMTKNDLMQFMEDVNESIYMLEMNLNRASELIKSFKQIAVNQSGDIQTKFNLKEIIDNVILSLKHEYKKAQHVINNNCDENIEIYSFPGAFSQIFTNFVMNSIKHGFKEKSNGNINFYVERYKDFLKIIYTDDGCGIKESDLNRIYEPFFTTNLKGGNSGLGMYIVYNIVTQKLEGEINCTSNYGEGVKFIIEIPIKSI